MNETIDTFLILHGYRDVSELSSERATLLASGVMTFHLHRNTTYLLEALLAFWIKHTWGGDEKIKSRLFPWRPKRSSRIPRLVGYLMGGVLEVSTCCSHNDHTRIRRFTCILYLDIGTSKSEKA